MTIQSPDLDDKSYEELLEEARQRLPAFDDGWTNYNPSDPGIAILELLAYLTDTYTYQLDTITDDHRKKYLQLLGKRRQPPEAATVQLTMTPPEGSDQPRIPAGTKLTVVDNTDTDRVFETNDEVVLLDTSIERVVTEHGDGRTDHTQANGKEGMFFKAFGPQAERSNALYIGFDSNPFDGVESLPITVDFHDGELPDPATHGTETPKFYPSVNVQWEYCTDYESADRRDVWEPLSVTRDGTYAFYRGGRVRLQRPAEWTPDEWGVDDHGVVDTEPGLVWLRCRILEGGYEIPPQLDSVRLNVVEATHRSTVEQEELSKVHAMDTPEKLTEQRYAFEHGPVLEATITVDGHRWSEVPDFDSSGPTDRHYVLDSKNGEILFGDGIAGEMPRPDATVVAEEYAFGGTTTGNVPKSTNWQFQHRDTQLDDGLRLGEIEVTGVNAGTGGTDAETLEEAFRRTKRDLETTYRAVTADDYEFVATHTPGLRFGRATVSVSEQALPDRESELTAVTVVVVPYAPPDQPRPSPSEGFLDAVERHLDKYRLLTDRVNIESPEYVGLTLDIEIQISTWLPESRINRTIETKIAEYLHPIHGYEGDGWPFGRPLYNDELVALLEEIPVVDHVREMSTHARGNARVDGDGNVLLDDAGLLALDAVETEIWTVSNERNGG